MSLEVGCARDQQEGEPARISPAAGEHRAPLLRGMEDGVRPCSIRAGPRFPELPVEGTASAEAPVAQPWEGQGGLTSRDRIKEFWVSLGWSRRGYFWLLEEGYCC